MKKTIAVICGGKSPEHEVSLVSSELVIKSIDRDNYDVVVIGITKNEGQWRFYGSNEYKNVNAYNSGLLESNYKNLIFNLGAKEPLLIEVNGKLNPIKVDIFFPIVHGTNSEDGTLQGLLEQSNIPFVGCKTLDSAVCMDKEFSKKLCSLDKIPVVPCVYLNKTSKLNETEIKKLGLPLFIKPSSSGSSFGITKVSSFDKLKAAIEEAFKYSSSVLIEKAINAREIECAVLGNWDEEVKASELGEIAPKKEFYSYEAKYIDSNGADLLFPVKLNKLKSEKIKKYAVKIFKLLKCHGMARVDFFVDKKTGAIYFNEINTIPGFTSISMYPRLWKETGIDNKALISKLVDLATKESTL